MGARTVTCKIRQSGPGPPGLSLLPYELLDCIFASLTGREISAARLACREWEVVCRPFWAAEWLHGMSLWLTSGHVARLEQLASRLGQHMNGVHVVPIHFTMRGMRELWSRYRLFLGASSPGRTRQTRLLGGQSYDGCFGQDRFESLYMGPTIIRRHTNGIGRNCTPVEWGVYHDRARARRFMLAYGRGIVTQSWLMWRRRQTVERLAAVNERLESCNVQIKVMDFSPSRLNRNRFEIGRAAPEWPTELALFCSSSMLYNGHFTAALDDIVSESQQLTSISAQESRAARVLN